MAGEDAHRPKPPALICVSIEVRETDVSDQGAGSGADVAATCDDGHGRPGKRGDLQPCSPLRHAQEQSRVGAERMSPDQSQPGLGGQKMVPGNARAGRAAGGGDGAEIVIEET